MTFGSAVSADPVPRPGSQSVREVCVCVREIVARLCADSRTNGRRRRRRVRVCVYGRVGACLGCAKKKGCRSTGPNTVEPSETTIPAPYRPAIVRVIRERASGRLPVTHSLASQKSCRGECTKLRKPLVVPSHAFAVRSAVAFGCPGRRRCPSNLHAAEATKDKLGLPGCVRKCCRRTI